MKQRIYLETTIPSYLVSKPSRNAVVAGHQRITCQWWRTRRKSFDVYISQFVIDEAALGRPSAANARLAAIAKLPLLDITENVLLLASSLLRSGVIPPKAATDAAHVAVSAVHGMKFLVTWNCAHLANALRIDSIRRVCEDGGYPCPVICTPEQLMED